MPIIELVPVESSFSDVELEALSKYKVSEMDSPRYVSCDDLNEFLKKIAEVAKKHNGYAVTVVTDIEDGPIWLLDVEPKKLKEIRKTARFSIEVFGNPREWVEEWGLEEIVDECVEEISEIAKSLREALEATKVRK